MITLRHWGDLTPYGIDLLTGEACALGYRGLFDLTEQGLAIIQRVIGAVELKAPENMNSGAVASLLLPYSMFEAIAVFALLLKDRCKLVAISYEDQYVLGIPPLDPTTRETLERLMEANRIKNYRILTAPGQVPGVTVGFSNVHQMSGRIA